jgi:hypothetical protein
MSQRVELLARALRKGPYRLEPKYLGTCCRHYGAQVAATESQFQDSHATLKIDERHHPNLGRGSSEPLTVWQRYIYILLGLISVFWLYEESSIHSGKRVSNIRFDILTDNTGLRDP